LSGLASGEDPRLYIGLDLGGTEVKFGVGTADGVLLSDGRAPSNARHGGEAILEALGEATTRALAVIRERGGTLGGLGMGTPGVVDPATGRIRYPVANLGGWCGTDVGGFFRERFPEEPGLATVILENDANAAAWGEYTAGAGRGAHTMVMTTVGTGIGGGCVLEGTLIRGANGGGMELGHSVHTAGGRDCHCGLRGCIEAYAGGRAMADEWGRRAAAVGQAIETAEDGLPQLPDLLRAAAGGDPLAGEVLDEGARALGHGLGSVLHLLNPDVRVLGGGILHARPRYRELVVEAARESVLPKAWEELRIVPAECGNRAGMIGALTLAATAAGAGPDGRES